MLNNKIITRVPRYIVIISLSGLLDRPKSATLAIYVPLFSITKTFKLFKSRWMMGGFISCKANIPFAIWIAILILCFHDRAKELAFLWSKSKRLQHCKTKWEENSLNLILKGQQVTPEKNFFWFWYKWVTISRIIWGH